MAHNRRLGISDAPTEAKSWEPAYSQTLNQNKIDRQWSNSQTTGGSRWCLETGVGGRGGGVNLGMI